MLINPALIGHLGVGAEIGLLIALVPEIQPVTQQNTRLWLFRSRGFDALPQPLQLCHALGFGFGEDILGHREAFFIVAHHVSTLPAAVLSQVDAAIPAFSVLCHGAISSPK